MTLKSNPLHFYAVSVLVEIMLRSGLIIFNCFMNNKMSLYVRQGYFFSLSLKGKRNITIKLVIYFIVVVAEKLDDS